MTTPTSPPSGSPPTSSAPTPLPQKLPEPADPNADHSLLLQEVLEANTEELTPDQLTKYVSVLRAQRQKFLEAEESGKPAAGKSKVKPKRLSLSDLNDVLDL